MTAVARAARASRIRFALYDGAAIAPLWLRIASMIVGLGLSAVVIDLTSSSPNIFGAMWASTLGTSIGLTQLGQLATPLLLAAAAVAVARRAGLWNIGVDGQMILGAWTATLVAFHAGGLPGWLLVVLMLIVSAIAGAVWALGPALARAYLNVNEVITTLMLNFVGGLWIAWWATGPWSTNGSQLGALSSKSIPESTFLHQFRFGSFTLGLGFFIAVFVIVVLALAFRYLRYGYHVTLASGDAATARYAGVHQGGIQLSTFLLSGAIGGFAGAVMELDQTHAFSTSLTSNTGYIGLVVAVLAGTSLLGVLPVAVLLTVVVSAGNGLRLAGISSDLVLLVTGLLLLIGGAADLLVRYRLHLSSPRDPEDPEATAGAQKPPIGSSVLETTP